MKHRTHIRAFSLVELIIVVAVVAMLVTIAIPHIRQARVDTVVATNESTARTLNDAISAAKVAGDTTSLLYGNDVDEVKAYLLSEGYLRPDVN